MTIVGLKESSPQLGDRHNCLIYPSLCSAHYNGVGNELRGGATIATLPSSFGRPRPRGDFRIVAKQSPLL